jgi:hypothetical protein
VLILGVVVLASFVASFTDWLFMDALIHRYYAYAPEVWLPNSGVPRIIVSQIIGTAASAAVVMLCLLAPGRPLLVAGAAWCAGPLPVVLQYWQWVRIDPRVSASHAVGWLARLVIATMLAGWILPK